MQFPGNACPQSYELTICFSTTDVTCTEIELQHAMITLERVKGATRTIRGRRYAAPLGLGMEMWFSVYKVALVTLDRKGG